ncbi:putative uridine kinase [Fadolivirus algeromassiliense]|jgi:hypothetical protein|uniref:Uridine kinase n=1 Tax=Fadolivirus FV1/VV64 TaxID=3070911 RepID=A0A7D3UVK1_9VIRU|nr:putative uridine kinase [Fadolivirus algeromassiliense]QKF94229.1 putative uridine kinase [Fadolivirus FV1/VV64]
MNIVEAYIKFNKQLLIFISGLPGCGKLKLAKNVSRDFKIKIIDQYDYYKKDYNVTANLPDGTKLINWYTNDAIDWDKFNEDIDKLKVNGLIVIGVSLIESHITSKPDYHFHLNISKQLCMDKRKDFLKEHKDKYEEEYKVVNTPIEKLKMNQLIFPYYLESIKKSKVNKFININEMTDDQVYDMAFDTLIEMIKKYLKQDDEIQQTEKQTSSEQKTPKVSNITNDTKQTDDDENISATFELLDKPKYSYDQELDMVTSLSDPDDYDSDKGEGPIKIVEV